MTGQGSVTIPPVYESRVLRDFTLVGDEIPQVLRKKKMREHANTRVVGGGGRTPDQTLPKQTRRRLQNGSTATGKTAQGVFFVCLFCLVTGNVSTMSFHHTTRNINDDKQLLRLRQKQGSSRFSQSECIRMQTRANGND